MLIACSLVNLTTWEQAEPALLELRSFYPTPSNLVDAHHARLKRILRPLGLWRIRSKRLRVMASAWIMRAPQTASDVLSFPGCGRYASDSWAIFIDGRTDVYPDDGKLVWYMEGLRAQQSSCNGGTVSA